MMTEQQQEATFEQAMRANREWYCGEVRDFAKGIMDEAKDEHDTGKEDEELREWLLERLHETCDSSQIVIYTYRAQAAVLASDNDGAYIDEYGTEGLIQDGCLKWECLAYAALHRDIIEHMDGEGLDVNDPGAFFEDDT